MRENQDDETHNIAIELRRLTLQQQQTTELLELLTRRLEAVTTTRQPTPPATRSQPNTERPIQIGDRVFFQKTFAVKAGTGTVVGFTKTGRLQIQSDRTKETITRKPTNASLINSP